MSIRPIDFNGMLQRTEDVSIMKHHEDAKPVVDQQNIQTVMERQNEQTLHRVNEQQESDRMDNHADAREEGKGTYFKRKNDKNKDEDELTQNSDGRVVRKISQSIFDIKI